MDISNKSTTDEQHIFISSTTEFLLFENAVKRTKCWFSIGGQVLKRDGYVIEHILSMDYIFSTLAYILEQLNAWSTRDVHEAFYLKCEIMDTWSGVQALRQGQNRRIVKIYYLKIWPSYIFE